MAPLLDYDVCCSLASPIVSPLRRQRPCVARWKNRIQGLGQTGRRKRVEGGGSTNTRLCAEDGGFEAQYPPLETKRFRLEGDAEGRELVIETGAIGRQANGAVLAKQGDTVIYTTACCKADSELSDFAPLSVHYIEKLSSVGRTAEKQRDHEVLTSRIVDRSIRPLFPEGWSKETQVLETVMSYDGVNSTEPLAITAAGAALALSDLPFTKAVVGVRVGWLGKPVINPTVEEQEQSKLDLVLAGTADGVIMIEASADFIKEKDLLRALETGTAYITMVSKKLEAWIQSVRKEKMEDGIIQSPKELPDVIFAFCHDDLQKIFSKTSKKERNVDREALWRRLEDAFVSSEEEEGKYDERFVRQAYKKCESRILRERMLQSGLRIDGRRASDIRPISTSANILPRTHGSALFTRGNTQALCVATLGSQKAAQRIDTLQEEDLMRFYFQYYFPSSSVGEVRRFMLHPGRRELGHGQLASWALAPAVPEVESFPYTIRLESTITESDGSSSMASVCGGYLAMMDAGVPMKRAVAGIAMGLMLDTDSGSFIVLSDIMGTEDALGDMDLKVAGSVDAVSAIQMDVKVGGVTYEILSATLEQAKEGRQHILREMRKCHPPVRRDLSPYAPHIKTITIDPSKTGLLIGPGGKYIRAAEEMSGVETIMVDQSGEIEINGPSFEAVQKAEQIIHLMVGELKPGQRIEAVEVSGVKEFGAFVDLAPGRTGLIHVSELCLEPVVKIADVVKIGDVFDVEVLKASSNGKCSLSRRAVLLKEGHTVPTPKKPPTLREKPVLKSTPIARK